MDTAPFSTRYVNPAPAAERQPLACERALVLGGGGSAGNAWLIGVVAGLLDAGLDVTRADVMIGTSAGATAAAQLTGASPARLFADVVDAVAPRPAGPPGPGTGPGPAHDVMRTTADVIAGAADPSDMRRRMGAAALATAAASDDAGRARWRGTVAARLPSPYWPQQPVLVTAVDARSGEPVVFDRHSGVELVDAVAASCANGFAYRIGDGRYLDGGYRRSSENADLAAGSARVLVLSPLGGRTRMPPGWNMQLAAQVDELQAAGSVVETVLPDADSLAAFGGNLMDPTTRPPAARAGFAQGRALAPRLSGWW